MRIDNALEEADEEIAKPNPDRDEIGQALERALKYSSKAQDFATTAGKLQIHITNTVSWLGDNWLKLLPLVGLKL